MGTRWISGAAVVLALGLAGGGCTVASPPGPAPVASPPIAKATPPPVTAEVRYPVGLRILKLHRGPHRPLPTMLFYPAGAPQVGPAGAPQAATPPTGRATNPQAGQTTAEMNEAAARTETSKTDPAGRNGTAGQTETSEAKTKPAGRIRTAGRAETASGAGTGRGRAGAVGSGRPPAFGRFPLVLFSHGMSGSPKRVAATLAEWASAGFVVAAPSYPFTHEHCKPYLKKDIVNQPDDLRYVLARVRALNFKRGDPLRGRIDGDHVAAVGHSAGGYTTTGLFVAGHDPRLRAGVVLSGWRARGAFAGPPARMLFLQGTADPVVPMARSRAAYERVPWPKSYLVLPGVSHANYLRPGELGYPRMEPVVTDFLRWTLKGDQAAVARLPRDYLTADSSIGTWPTDPLATGQAIGK